MMRKSSGKRSYFLRPITPLEKAILKSRFLKILPLVLVFLGLLAYLGFQVVFGG